MKFMQELENIIHLLTIPNRITELALSYRRSIKASSFFFFFFFFFVFVCLYGVFVVVVVVVVVVVLCGTGKKLIYKISSFSSLTLTVESYRSQEEIILIFYLNQSDIFGQNCHVHNYDKLHAP